MLEINDKYSKKLKKVLAAWEAESCEEEEIVSSSFIAAMRNNNSGNDMLNNQRNRNNAVERENADSGQGRNRVAPPAEPLPRQPNNNNNMMGDNNSDMNDSIMMRGGDRLESMHSVDLQNEGRVDHQEHNNSFHI